MKEYSIEFYSKETGRRMAFNFYATKNEIDILKNHSKYEIIEILDIIPIWIANLGFTVFYSKIINFLSFKWF